jgi:prephenate dehydrogenase
MFKKVAIIGPGLIGGSMGLILRRRRLADRVVGVGRRQVTLDKVMRVGAADEVTLDMAEGLREADLVVLATPIGSFAGIMEGAAALLAQNAILTEVGSAKASVIETVTAALRERPDVSFVPTHPMAGSEQAGPLAADHDLFRGAVCIITPLPDCPRQALDRIEAMWAAFGARIAMMDPETHDDLVARISHVPHLAAAALMAVVDDDDARFCGGGLRDTTRIASGSPAMWLDICKANHAPIHKALLDYVGVLQGIGEALSQSDLTDLERMLQAAKEKRDRLNEL